MTRSEHHKLARRLSSLPVKENCILCGELNPDHQVTTFAANDNIHQMILELQDSTLLPRVCGFNLMAEVKQTPRFKTLYSSKR